MAASTRRAEQAGSPGRVRVEGVEYTNDIGRRARPLGGRTERLEVRGVVARGAEAGSVVDVVRSDHAGVRQLDAGSTGGVEDELVHGRLPRHVEHRFEHHAQQAVVDVGVQERTGSNGERPAERVVDRVDARPGTHRSHRRVLSHS